MKRAVALFVALIAAAPVVFAGPKIAVDESTHNFGASKTGSSVEHEFTLRNDGDTTLTIKSIKPACGCTVAELSDTSLEPGETTQLEATLSLKNRTGMQRRSITVTSDDPETPSLKLWLTGEAISAVAVTPKTLLFGQLAARQVAVSASDATERLTRYVDVVVTDPNESLALMGVHVETSSDRPEWRGSWSAEFEQIEPGLAYRVAVTCLPKAGYEGELKGLLRIETDHADYPVLRVPISATVAHEIGVTPREIVLIGTEDEATRHVIVSKGATRQEAFHITGTTAPSDGVDVSVRPAGQRGYIVTLTGLSASDPELQGGALVLETDIDAVPRIEVPIRLETIQ